MDKASISSVFVLPIASGLVVWLLFFASTLGQKPTSAPVALQDTPDRILNYVRTSQSPVVLINFWASWCEPCKEELPALKKLEQKFLAQGLKIILISIDDLEEVPDAKTYLRENQLNFTTFYKGTQPLRFVAQIFPKWSGAVPATLLMNRDLKILDAWEGDTTLEEFEQRVTPHLRGKS